MNLTQSNPVFVVGTLRSGTSLLLSLLNQHPQVALMFECDVWDFPEFLSNLRFRGHWLERQEFYNRVLSRHRLILGRSLRGLENVRTPEDLYRVFSEGKVAAFWGEKSPFYGDRLRWLAELYPHAQFILIWRDPVETYRSVTRAGRRSRFFGRRGMVRRLIRYQEEMIRQTAELSKAGVRMHHVTYDVLVNRPEQTCRAICDFLNLEFEPKMLDISQADFSAMYPGEHHDHLRRGKIERQQFADSALETPIVLRKLQRFQRRWQRLTSPWLPQPQPPASLESREPSQAELVYHRIAGAMLNLWDGAKRALFEFLPFPWLRTYREMKAWFIEPGQSTAQRVPLREQFRSHWITIITSYLVLAGVAVVDFTSGPRMTVAPFYLLPCAALTLVLNRGWGTFAALLSIVVWSALQNADHSTSYGIVVWNVIMRFLVFQIVIVLLDRIRAELNSASGVENPRRG